MVLQNFADAAEMAHATGRAAEAAAFDAMLPTLRAQYHVSFFDPAGNIYGDGTPTAFGCALWLGVTPPALLPTVVSNFVAQVTSVGYKMSTMGFIGVRYDSYASPTENRGEKNNPPPPLRICARTLMGCCMLRPP